MTVRGASTQIRLWEDFSFLLANRIPRQLATRLFGWFSHIEAPLLTLRLDCDLAAICRSRPERRANPAFHEPARVLHARTEARRAPDRPQPGYNNQPLRCDYRSVRTDRQRRADPSQRIFLHVAGFADRPATRGSLSQWRIRHVAADAEHVSPLPCAIRLHSRKGQVHFRRYLERRSDRAQSHSKIILQE